MNHQAVLKKVLRHEFVDEAVDRACYLLERYATGTVLKDRVAAGDLGAMVTQSILLLKR